ncbi:MAG: YaeQ family protein [Halobacteriovoraceae bacterium]|jgi:uncharacterized protein YaeQ|nr:YaeQ family protein [Halobacteriovoraceae bacterium]
MALGSSIFKININLSNLDTHFYEDYDLTIAKHPSESESRMMYRLLAFLYCAHKDLEFTRGLSNVDEPSLWQKNDIGEIIQWIDIGQPELKRIRQSLGKSHNVKIFTYQDNKAEDWYDKIKGNFINNIKLEIFHLKLIDNGPIDKFVKRSMKLSCVIEEGSMFLGDDNERIHLKVVARTLRENVYS